MTALTKPVRRETASTIKGRPIVIELHPWGIRMREKGRRYHLDVGFRECYDLAAKLTARALITEKKLKKKSNERY